MIKLIHLLALDEQLTLGKDNKLCWHIPEDLRYFKDTTHSQVVVCGTKTLASMPKLRGRYVVAIGTPSEEHSRKADVVINNLEDALAFAKDKAKSMGNDSVFIIGGGSIYAQTLHLVDELLITRVSLDIEGGVKYPSEFSRVFKEVNRSRIKEDNKIFYYFSHWIKK